MKFKVNGVTQNGLLDCGANPTVTTDIEFLKEQNIAIYPYTNRVITADGKEHAVLGYAKIPFEYRGRKVEIPTLVMPTFKEKYLLGMSFWKAYGIRPAFAPIKGGKVKRGRYLEMPGQFGEEIFEVENPERQNRFQTPPIKLTGDQEKILDLAKKLFPAATEGVLSQTHLIEHDIDVGDCPGINQKSYPYSPYIMEEVRKIVDGMVKRGIAEPTKNTGWNNPFVVVRKANGTARLCLDLRKVNAVTLNKDTYPLPRIDTILSRLQETKYISALDLKEAFWQIPLSRRARRILTFAVQGKGLFQMTRMPFGACTASQTMCRLMDLVLGHDLEPYVFAYLDDIVIVTGTFEKHVEMLKEVAKRLTDAKLMISVEKSKFCQSSMKFLGYVVDERGISVDPDKVAAIKEYPRPKTVKEVRRFVGMAGYYNRFVPNFSKLSAALTDLVKKRKITTVEWNDRAEESFNALKEALVTAPVLANPDWKKQFKLHTDASDFAIGAMLTQGDGEEERPIAYMSRKLIAAQNNYTVSEKECLAIVSAIEHFRGYIDGVRFKVITDHAALTWLNTFKNATGRIARWQTYLGSFQFDVEYKKGSHHVVPDALSRVDNAPEPEKIWAVTLDTSVDRKYDALKNAVKENPKNFPDLKLDEERGMLYKFIPNSKAGQDKDFQWKIYVPESEIPKVLAECHATPLAPHFGVFKTMRIAKKTYYWPYMGKSILNHVRNCETCQAIKAPNFITRKPMVSHQVPQRKFQVLCIDFATDLTRSKKGNANFFICVDLLTKYPLAYASKKADADRMVAFLEDVFLKYGVPETIISDNGKQFVSKVYQNFLKKWGVTAKLTPYYHPQANPAERVIRVLKTAIKSFAMDKQNRWDEHFEEHLAGIRSAVHETTQISPYHLLFGQEMCLSGQYPPTADENDAANKSQAEHNANRPLAEARRNVQAAQKRWTAHYNKKAADIKYNVGDWVLRQNFKLSNKAEGYNAKQGPKYLLAKIIEDKGSGVYRTRDKNGKIGTYHSDVLKPASGIITRSRKDEIGDLNIVNLVEELPDSDFQKPKSESWVSQKTRKIKSAMSEWFENAAFDVIFANNLHSTC